MVPGFPASQWEESVSFTETRNPGQTGEEDDTFSFCPGGVEVPRDSQVETSNVQFTRNSDLGWRSRFGKHVFFPVCKMEMVIFT